jgi:DNA excision repair protein ERCC-2
MDDEILFPHDEMRDIQLDLVKEIMSCLESKKSIIAHAPTGLGKTAASLAPALTYALKNKKTIFFLTSRHTQHVIALETLKKIREKHDVKFIVADIIGKKHLCLQPGVSTLYSREFIEYCKSLIENSTCEFYNNTYDKSKLSVRAKEMVERIKEEGKFANKEILEMCTNSPEQLCPYEICQQLAKEAKVIVADYYYVFNPDIQANFLKKIGKELSDIIIIVDEAHNLPERIRELMTSRLTTVMIDRAIHEAKAMNYSETVFTLNKIKQILTELAKKLYRSGSEVMLTKEDFIDRVKDVDDYDKIVDDLQLIGDEIRKEKKRSYIASIAEFLNSWKGEDKGFMRYVKKDFEKDEQVSIIYRCLDPSLLTKEVVNSAHSVIMMSGTLNPTYMYKDLLGFEEEKVVEKEYESPFPEENRLCMIIPETSTKFTARSDQQYRRIAEICAETAGSIGKNTALFFPSYDILNRVLMHFKFLYPKTVFAEHPKMSPEEKQEMMEKFKTYKDKGAALLAAATGSYGEGIDLPGDLLQGVIVVGLPLQKPDLETQELIKYYDVKFKKGWDYGYIFPAFNKTLQNAGRCIRSKDDRGVIVFLDERYAWSQYYRCFPKEMKIKVTKNYKEEIVNFFW